MKSIKTYLTRYAIFLYAIIIHLFFYISSLKTYTFDYFFSWGNVHDHQGIDFYQVPNAAYAWLRGGDLIGDVSNMAPYAYGNRNVYHPLFTLLVGLPLQFLSPRIAFYVWFFVHFAVTFLLVYIFLVFFGKKKHSGFAFLIFLGLFPHYLEIWNGQYHFLLNAGLFFLLLAALRKQEKAVDGFAYAWCLLVKPIGLLWLPILFLHKRFKTLSIGIGLYILATAPFIVNKTGIYYVQNLIERAKYPIGGPPGIFTLDALLRFWDVSSYAVLFVKLCVVIGLLFIHWKLKLNLFQSFFLWIAFYLLFYDLVFEYHYTILAPILALGIISQKAFQTLFAKIISIFYLFPTPFFIFHFFQIYSNGQNVTDTGWVFLVLFRIMPLIALAIFIMLYKYYADGITLNKNYEKHKKT